jgi:tetratricopeptide (TPR) repeat protein
VESPTNKSVNQLLSEANLALKSRDIDNAERLTEQALYESPSNPYALSFKLGLQLSTKKILQADATVELLLSDQCQITDPQLFINIAQTLLKYSRFCDALMIAKAGLNRYESNLMLQGLGINAAIEARDLDAAKKMAEKWLINSTQQNIQGLLTTATLHLKSGDFEPAKECFLAVLNQQADNSYALTGLTKTQAFKSIDSVLVSRFQTAIKASSCTEAAARIGFGLAKLYNDAGDYEKAWQTAEQANIKKSQTASFDCEQFTRQVDKLLTLFSPANIQAQHSDNTTEHVFVVGMPRSGTTLIEQILSVIPDFYAGGETPAIDYCLAFGKYGSNYLQAFKHHQDLNLAAMSTAYDDYFHQFANFSGNRIINKVPTNFFNIGLIKLLFPKAKIINMHRAPLDLAVSIFFENFSQYFAYTNSLDNTFHVYQQYQRLMQHWSGLYGGDILTVNYQNLVESYSQTVRQIGDFIHADMPSVEHIRGSSNPVETPSVWQVRQPINTNAVNRWQHYEQFLLAYIERYQ